LRAKLYSARGGGLRIGNVPPDATVGFAECRQTLVKDADERGEVGLNGFGDRDWVRKSRVFRLRGFGTILIHRDVFHSAAVERAWWQTDTPPFMQGKSPRTGTMPDRP
jgi:hypothetical protein